MECEENFKRKGNALSLKPVGTKAVLLESGETGYTCCWCQQERGELVMLPHPSSNQPVRHVKTPRDATIVGRVVAAWLSFVQLEPSARSLSLR